MKNNLMSRVKKIESTAKKEQLAKDREAEKERARKKQFLGGTTAGVYRILHELHGHYRLEVKILPKPDQWGTVATISRGKEYLASVVVKWETYMFRGSDESPGEEVECLRIYLAEQINGTRDVNAVNLGDFRDGLAEWLVEKKRHWR